MESLAVCRRIFVYLGSYSHAHDHPERETDANEGNVVHG